MQRPVPGPGAIIAGKYRIHRVVGEGGMGVVLAAEHLQLGQPVAIKLLHAGADDNVIQRFLREARVVAQLRSVHVPRMFDVDRLETGEPYLVMELLEGQDLDQIVATDGPLPVPEAVAAVIQACDAIGEAHAYGVVHRDLKPANLFVVQSDDGLPCVKVLDFGLAKLRTELAGGGSGPALTRTGSVFGSPVYMSPEQWTSARDADERSDVWALGTILYELLAGRPPFLGNTMGELCAAVMHGPIPSLGARRSDLPPGLEAVVGRCLARDPAARFQSVVDLVRALRLFAPARVHALAERMYASGSFAPVVRPTAVGPTLSADSPEGMAAMARLGIQQSFAPPAPATGVVGRGPSYSFPPGPVATMPSVPPGPVATMPSVPPGPVATMPSVPPGLMAVTRQSVRPTPRSRVGLGLSIGLAVFGLVALAAAVLIVMQTRPSGASVVGSSTPVDSTSDASIPAPPSVVTPQPIPVPSAPDPLEGQRPRRPPRHRPLR